jgi:hypothetical protein
MAGPRPGPEFEASYHLAVSADRRLARFEQEDGDLPSYPRPIVGVSGEDLLGKSVQPRVFVPVGDLSRLKSLAAEFAVGMPGAGTRIVDLPGSLRGRRPWSTAPPRRSAENWLH